ncbi:MAG: sulfatase-like hydrolase/transferase [Planctomycetota bacterium]|nr:sulfatase-like hydrolase/transferase [Planctomycetota bacterium]
MTEPSRPRRRDASRSNLVDAGFQLWLLNILVGIPVGSLWLFRATAGPKSLPDPTLWQQMFPYLALVSCIVVLGILLAIPMALAQRFVRIPLWVGVWQSLAGAIFLSVLYTDTVVFSLLGYHFNGAILNVFVTEGSGDAVHLGSEVFITAILMILGLAVLQYFFWRWRLGRILAHEARGNRQILFLQPRVVCLAVFLPLITIEKATYALASVTEDRVILYSVKPLPTLKPRLGPYLDSLREERKDVHSLLATVYLGGEEGQKLNYPHSRPEIPADAPRPNVLMIVLDSWRQDAMSETLTPNLSRRAQQARTFVDHKSGGNGTRFGLFTMLYGLHGSYWFRALENNTTPVLLDTLQDLDYDIRVISAASMNFPEFRSTAWYKLESSEIVDSFLKPDGEEITRRSDVKDGLVADDFVQWMDDRNAAGEDRPYFSFVLLDSPHQPYFNPGGPHQPALDRPLNYISQGITKEEPELGIMREKISNTYKNSVLYADGVAEKILARAEQVDREHPNAAGTIVLITGDHGEEFYESGFWGHTSNYTPEQIDVPFFMYGPGIEPGIENSPTSHLDVSNSILELLGADPELRLGYTQGESLFDPLPERARVVAGFADVGLLTDQGIIQMPSEAGKQNVWVFSDRWKPMPEMDAIITQQEGALQTLIRECQQFLSQTP